MRTKEIETNLRPKDFASRMGISTKQVRAILRQNHPREVKGTLWEITPELAKQIVKDYKAQIKSKEAEKKAKVEQELAV